MNQHRGPAEHHAHDLAAVLRNIRALRVLDAQEALDVIQCLATVQSTFDIECLDDCIRSLEDTIADQGRESDAADWMQQRDRAISRMEAV